MRKLKKHEIKLVDKLNNRLKEIEKDIYDICFEQNEIALKKLTEKENNILDYELEVNFYIYGDTPFKSYYNEDEKLLAFCTENVKRISKKEKWWGINDNKCHNTTSVFQQDQELNSQKHCWLLHTLYDHFSLLDWDNILNIENIDFDVRTQYDYSSKIVL